MPRSYHRTLSVILLSALALSVFITQATQQRVAPIMPLAAQSLLIDVTTAGERLIAAGERGHIVYSDDAGTHWQQAIVPTTQMLTAVSFIDEQRGWAVGHDGLILASDDGGAHWRIQRDGLAVQEQINLERREAALRAVRALSQATAAERSDDLALALEDAQMDLEDAEAALAEPVFTAPLLDVWFENADRGWAVGAFGTLVETRDGGLRWSTVNDHLDNPYEYHLNTVTGNGNGGVFVAGEGGVMFRSLDSGANWESLPPVYDGSWFGSLHLGTPESLLVFGLRGNIFRSTDFGSTWEDHSTSSRQTISGGSASGEGEIVLAGNVGTLLHSTDGGRQFTLFTLQDRLALSAATVLNGRFIAVGQGGVRVIEATVEQEQ